MKTAAAPPAMEEAPPLVFQWEGRRRTHWRLGALVALSLLVHAIGFYVLQVAYTPTGSQLPPPVQVMMARPERPDDSPEMRAQSRALSRWLTVTDPSLATQPTTPASIQNPGVYARYVPSYKAAPPPFKSLDPPAVGSASPPRPLPPGPVPMPSAHAGTHASGPSPATRVTLSDSIAPLMPLPLPAVAFTTPAGAKTLGRTVFLVGVRPEGDEPFLFREGTSGEVSADDYARDYLARLRFQPPAMPNGATIWGWAAFDWGWDVYR